jgi:hypothetical protein
MLSAYPKSSTTIMVKTIGLRNFCVIFLLVFTKKKKKPNKHSNNLKKPIYQEKKS